MSTTEVDALNKTLQKTHEWLEELTRIGDYSGQAQAYSVLRAVLHTIRDRLQPDEAADLASQMPMLVRGLYYEGYNPGATPIHIRTQKEFLEVVERRLGRNTRVDPELACRSVFDLLDNRISLGEIQDVRHMLPGDIRMMWPGA